jgi:D-glycero-D-manno-heptose 1,7-bisphosphate phosphatase
MVPFHGRPFLAYLLDQLRGSGFEDVLVLTGYLGEQIVGYFGDGTDLGLRLSYSHSPVEAETGQRLKTAAAMIDDRFLLMYCDNYWPMDVARMRDMAASVDVPAVVTVYANRDGYTRSNMLVDDAGYVTAYDPARTTQGLNGVEIGYAMLDHKVLDLIPEGNVSFEHTGYPHLVSRHEMMALRTEHRYYSVGSHERLPLTEAFLAPQRAVILDRDGVLNERPPQAEYIQTWEGFRWLPGALEAVKLFKRSGHKLILVTNQPGIARGVLTEEALTNIHGRMQAELAQEDASLDAIYFCPHGWDEGCFCRKPSPGMLFEAQRDFHLDLTKTTFFGDDERDIQAGEAAGCRTVLVSEDFSLLDATREYLSQDGR